MLCSRKLLGARSSSIIFSLIAVSQTWANQITLGECRERMQSVLSGESGNVISKKLSSVPFAVNAIAKLLTDSRLSSVAKTNVIRALRMDELKIMPMTPELLATSLKNPIGAPAMAFRHSGYPFVEDYGDPMLLAEMGNMGSPELRLEKK